MLVRSIHWLQTFWQDIRYAIRSFGRTPGFFLAVVTTIALGLGVNTALFTVFNAYALRPLAVHDPQSLYAVQWFTPSGYFFSPKESHETLAGLATVADALSSEHVFVKTSGHPFLGDRVSGNYFSMLGVSTVLGRPLSETDTLALSPAVVVLSYSTWKAKFASDPDILGKRLRMLGKSYEVIGVARPGFNGVLQPPPEFWVPQIQGDPRTDGMGVSVIARLKPGATRAQAESEMLVRARQLTADRPEQQRVVAVRSRPNATALPNDPELLKAFAPVAVAFLLVLLLACANVANMMLARSMGRQQEIGVRLSLGAARSRLIGQLLTESVVLAIPAALAGLVVSWLTVHFTEKLLFAIMPPFLGKMLHLPELAPDGRVFLFNCAACIGATLLFGLVPAIQAVRPSVTAMRGEFSDHISPSRLRSALVLCQVSICVLLLVCAGVLLQTSRKLAERDTGMDTRGVTSVEFNQAVPPQLAQRLSEQRGVRATAVAWHPPSTYVLPKVPVTVRDETLRMRAGYNFVSPDYFSLLRIPLLRGRNFTEQEASTESNVAIVSEATAKLFWPNRDALGQSIQIAASGAISDRGNPLPAFRTAQVIGIAKDVISTVVWEGLDPTCIYFPTHAQSGRGKALLIKFTADSDSTRRALDAVLESAAPDAVRRVTAMEELRNVQVWPFRIGFFIALPLGGLALLLTLSGIYGVLSYMVAQRTREIGIRMALGAAASAVVGLVVSQSVRLVLIGAACGIALALGVARLLAFQMESIDAFDPVVYAGGVAAVLMAGLTAAYFPSRQAARIDPMAALRTE